MLNAKKLVVTFSRAVSSLAMLAGALRLWSLELPEIAGFVMLTNISTIVFTIAFQLGDISIVIANAVSGGVRAARDASLAMRGAVDAIVLAKALRVEGVGAEVALKVARAVREVGHEASKLELEAERLRNEGWADVRVFLEADYNWSQNMDPLYQEERELTEDEAARVKAIVDERNDLTHDLRSTYDSAERQVIL